MSWRAKKAVFLAIAAWGTLLLLWVSLAMLTVWLSQAYAAGIPRASEQYRRDLTRIARTEWGLDAPVARLAAQIRQESSCRADARSPYAQGLTQFTRATAEDMARRWPADLQPAAPYSPRWAMLAQSRYMRALLAQAPSPEDDACSAWWNALRCYNGGCGWLKRELRIAGDPHRDALAGVCRRTGRSAANCRENTEYPERILRRWEPQYLEAGWPGEAVCPTT